MQQVNNFKKSLQFVLKWEVGSAPNGGYTNDSSDPGGETKWGISKRSHPQLNISTLSPEQAAQIYSDEYWDGAGCDSIPFPFCTAVFDTVVNLGLSRGIIWDKSLVNDSGNDPGDYHLLTVLSWLKQAKDCREFLDTRRRFYYSQVNKNPTSIKYLRGWLARLNDLQKFVDTNTNPIGENLPDMNQPLPPQYTIPVGSVPTPR